jgi:UDP-N-acetylmuramate dehydrogenase
LDIRHDFDLSSRNALALAARARHYISVTDLDGARAALRFARDRRLPVTVLGAGSNVVLAGDLPGLVIHMAIRGRRVVAERAGGLELEVGAGEDWHGTVEYCLQRGWYGLENLALIPGTVGAAPVQNIGAYGVELESRFQCLTALELATGRIRHFDRAACGFGYRDSVFKREECDRWLIASVRLSLRRVPAPVLDYPALRDVFGDRLAGDVSPEEVARAVVALRRERLPDPAQTPNAGSFFKNPVVTEASARALAARHPGLVTFPAPGGGVKLAAAWLIERCGWKGVQRGGAGVHERQALVLVNRGGGADALLALARAVRASVAERFGVELEIEPRILGGQWP